MNLPLVDENLYVRMLRNINIPKILDTDNLATRIGKHRNLISLLDSTI